MPIGGRRAGGTPAVPDYTGGGTRGLGVGLGFGGGVRNVDVEGVVVKESGVLG